MLYSPKQVLNGADIAFLGVHPGGSEAEPDRDGLAHPYGSAYACESWDFKIPGMHPLQRQVLALFQGLNVVPENVLAGNLIPFRAPSEKQLPDRQSAQKFGQSIWGEIFALAKPRLVIGTGSNVLRDPLFAMLNARQPIRVAVGWGDYEALMASYPGGKLVILPSLSRFKIVTRPESQKALTALFGAGWHDQSK